MKKDEKAEKSARHNRSRDENEEIIADDVGEKSESKSIWRS